MSDIKIDQFDGWLRDEALRLWFFNVRCCPLRARRLGSSRRRSLRANQPMKKRKAVAAIIRSMCCVTMTRGETSAS